MARFESHTVGRYTFGISVAAFYESYDPKCPSHVVLPLKSARFNFTHNIYVFCVNEALGAQSGSHGSLWKYYVLKSSTIPVSVQKLGYVTYDGLMTLLPHRCKRRNLERTILKVIAA